MAKILIYILLVLIIILTGVFLWKNNNASMVKKDIVNNNEPIIKMPTQTQLKEITIEYDIGAPNPIVITAPNIPDRPYYVYAVRKSLMWEIGYDDIIPPTESSSQTVNGVLSLEIRKVKQSDLDEGAGDYSQMQKYIGQPALYIEMSSVSSLHTSWLIVDVNSGKRIGSIALN